MPKCSVKQSSLDARGKLAGGVVPAVKPETIKSPCTVCEGLLLYAQWSDTQSVLWFVSAHHDIESLSLFRAASAK